MEVGGGIRDIGDIEYYNEWGLERHHCGYKGP